MLDQIVPARPKQVLDQTRAQPGRELGDRAADVTHRDEGEHRADDQRAHEEHDQGADVERQPHASAQPRVNSITGEVSVCAGSVTIQSSGTRLAKPMPSTTLAASRQPSTIQGLIPLSLEEESRRMPKISTAGFGTG